jgi:thiol-disulfide isomerase/thioredoxin
MIFSRSIIFLSTFFISSTSYAVKTDEAAPTCTSTSFYTGQPFQLEALKGKVVYLDFWASWCPPCKKSFPTLNTLHNELNQQGFEVVAINLDEEKSEAEKFLKQSPVDFTILYDGEGVCPSAFDVMAMPSSYIIDKKGIVRAVHLGFDEDKINAIRDSILTLLSE